ncbi:MrcB family domain-containing protein [Cetobacterium sp. SF1]|uniref:MrcB family domain-containing protein n=1 Tax=Cetobacterium sp. SF1 TaxID=3417654 RepID=UPI003CEB6C3F
MNIIKENFHKIMSEYLIEKKKPLLGNDLANFIRKTIITTLENKCAIDLEKYKLTGSHGQGAWAAVPWIGIFDKEITTSAQRGYYLVFLFNENMDKLYLSLNQGWTYYQKTFGKKQGVINIKLVTNKLKNQMVTLADSKYLNLESITLGNGPLAEGYELGHICGVEYKFANIPEDKVIINDLRNMMGIYLELKKLLKNFDFESIIKGLILDDNLFIKDEEQITDEIEKAPIVKEKIEPKDKLDPRITAQGLTWGRNPKFAKLALDKANYSCEYDNIHESFTSTISNKPYMEAHHLIPMNFQNEFSHSLDVPGNIISLCPNCHRKIHHAIFSEKKIIIEKLYNSRNEILKKYGLNITLEELLKKYS